MKIAEFEIIKFTDGRVEIYLRIFNFELSGKPIYSFADVVDNLKIISPINEEIDWEQLTSIGKEK